MKEKELFKYNYKINCIEFKNMLLLNIDNVFQKYILNVSLIISIIILIFSLINECYLDNTLLYICLMIFIIFFTSRIVISFFLRIKYFYLKIRNRLKNYCIEFYNDYLILDNDISQFKIKYSQVSTVFETKNNLYLYSGMIIPIIKNDLSEEKIEFIRNINRSIKNIKINKANIGDN